MNEATTSTENEYYEKQQKETGDTFNEEEELGGSMSFLEHLTELRERLIYSLIAIVVGFLIMLNFTGPMLFFLEARLPDQVQLQELTPAETLLTMIKIAIYAGLFIAFPFLFYQVWMFVAPGLYKREKKIVLPLIGGAWICFILGGAFCYWLVFEFALDFLSEFAPDFIIQQWTLSQFVSFTVRFILAFGLIFQEPVIILFLAHLGIVNTKMLIKFFPYALIIMFAISAFITPPDPISQLMCAFPLMFLYGISILIVRMTEKKKMEQDEEIA